MCALRSIALSIVITLSAAFSAGADCSAVAGLVSLLSELEHAGANGGVFTPEKLLITQRLSYRFDHASVLHALRGTEIEDQASLIAETVDFAPSNAGAEGGGTHYFPILANPRVRDQINRSRAILSRLDCPPPIGDADQSGYETALPRIGSASPENSSFDLLHNLRAIAIALIGISAALTPILFWTRWKKRQKRLARRFICMLPVTIIGRDIPPSIHQTMAVDISRKGFKVHAIDGYMPRMDTKTAIRIGPEDLLVQFKWANQHYLGGEFEHALSKGCFEAMLDLSHQNVEQAEREHAHA